MIIGITGVRPDKCGGYILPNSSYIKICQELEKHFLELKPEKILSGFALGCDLYAANVAFKLDIPVIACVPFIGQESYWTEKQKILYNKMLSKAKYTIIVSEGGFANYKYQLRNEFIVDNCDILIATISPNETSGGTFNCVEYNKKVNKPIIYIDPAV